MSTAATRSSAKPVGRKTLPKLPLSSEKFDEIAGFLLAAFALLLTASLVSHHPLDPSWLHKSGAAEPSVDNVVGPVGAQVSALAFALFGLVSFALPIMLGVEAFRRLGRRPRAEVKERALGLFGTLAVAPALIQLIVGSLEWRGDPIDSGGTLGVLVAGFLDSRLHTVGAFVVLATVLLVSSSLVVQGTLGELVGAARGRLGGLWARLALVRAQRKRRHDEETRRRRIIRHARGGSSPEAGVGDDGPLGDLAFDGPALDGPALDGPAHGGDEPEAPLLDESFDPSFDRGDAPRAGLSARLRERVEERSRRDAATARWSIPVTPRVKPPSARVEAGSVEPVATGDGGLIDLPLRVTPQRGEARFSVRKVTAAEREARLAAARDGSGASSPHGADRAELPVASAPGAVAVSSMGASIGASTGVSTGPAGPVPLQRAPSAPATGARLRPVEAEPVPGALGVGGGVGGSHEAVQEDLGIEIQPTELPPVNLLSTEKPVAHRDEAELVRRGDLIQESAAHFGVDGEIAGISPGPVITVYEFRPGPGIKVSKVVNLQDDLALALKADSVRIDRLPGRSALGLEVPNTKRSIIHLGQLLADERFQKAPSPLTMALGVDIHGTPVFYDLATMPHLLVAGATGAGKSVGLQAMITSILYKSTKADVKFIFIDPKRVELGVYSEIPHLKTEVVVEPKKAANALRWAVAEMERRYRLLAEVHVRSIDIYNRAISDPRERRKLSLEDRESEFSPDDFQRLPYYVIIIDELADLMMVASSDVEASIARLAQMARAVGIHLIIATQRPSVDVLTGTIKANFPCRLAFATATRHDSRTILDQVGSEKLLGKGDALFMPPGTSRIRRLHGAYISEQETAALVRWLKRRGKPDLDPTVVESPADEAGAAHGNDGPAEDDPLYDEAARLVVKERQASASFLQRRMRVGFSRAARLVDMLEADGLLGPAQGSKPRDVLVPVDYFDEIDSARGAVEG